MLMCDGGMCIVDVNNAYSKDPGAVCVNSYECKSEKCEGGVCVASNANSPADVSPPAASSEITKAVENKITEVYGTKLGIFPVTTEPAVIVGKLLKYAFGALGTAALLIFIYAGLKLIDSEGKAEKVTEAKRTLIYAAVGMVIIFSSYSIVNYLISKL